VIGSGGPVMPLLFRTTRGPLIKVGVKYMKTSPATARRNAALLKARNNMIARAMRRLASPTSMASNKEKNKLKKLLSPKKKSPVKRSVFARLFK